MSKANLWLVRCNKATICTLLLAVMMNYIGKFLAQSFELPLWLDMIGTVWAALVGGPIIGMISGAIINVVYGLLSDPIAGVYALVNGGIGLAVGILVRLAQIENRRGIIKVMLIVILISVIFSTVINLIFWGGTTGNKWGDAMFAWSVMHGMPDVWASIIDELIVDVPDKILTVLMAYGLFKWTPKSFVLQCQGEGEIGNEEIR